MPLSTSTSHNTLSISQPSLSPPMSLSEPQPKIRPVGTTEFSWCKAAPGGTGSTVLTLIVSKPPNIQFSQNALQNLQISYPILNSKLRFDSATASFSYVTPPVPYIKSHQFDLQSTAHILQTQFPEENHSISPFHLILEHELNNNAWQNPDPSSDTDLFFASLYTLENNKWVWAFRLHTSVCDRTSAVALLSEMLEIMGEGDLGVKVENGKEMEVSLGIEDYIPCGQGNKPFWARGVDMLGYSLNSFRLANLGFKDAVSPRMSRVVRLQMSANDTNRILSSCHDNEIKLSGVLAAATLVACHSLNEIPDDQWQKYGVVALMDCRSVLDPVLSSHHMGFYHSAILHTHDFKRGDELWELAKRIHSSFTNAKNKNKHFTDMSDLNFLMCKAIENPGLTPSASLRTSLVSVFEDPMIDHPNKLHEVIGLEDVIGCASVHGVGPSMAIFDTIRDGKLDCACVFPFPLHSREQMEGLIDEMKRVLLAGIHVEGLNLNV